MKYRSYEKCQEKKKEVSGKKVIGIDPAKEKHQVTVLDEEGMQMGNSFSIEVSYKGFRDDLWKKLGKTLGSFSKDEVVFAVESSCNLWKVLTEYLSREGYTVLLVSPLTTYQSRPMMNNDYSKTDPKDALLIANNAGKGYYSTYRIYGPEVNMLHSLCITYDKLTKDRNKTLLRLRALLEEIFPEYLQCVNVAIDTSLYLLEKYFLPEHFAKLDVEEEEWNIRRISKGNHNADTLRKIKEHAKHSIGVEKTGEEDGVRLILDCWIAQIRQLNKSIKVISEKMIDLARENEYFEILTSVMGISDISAARFIGECRDLRLFKHFKQIEKSAGFNLRISDSGSGVGMRRISRLGNKRLSKLIYQMTTQTARFIPEVRIKFLNRQLKKKSYRKNIIASSSNLLKILMALIKDRRKYEFREEKAKEMELLEKKYEQAEKKDTRKKKTTKPKIKKAA